MDEQRVPNLEELDEQEAYRFLAKLWSEVSAEAQYEVNHP
jgi:hypothetical protein